MKLIILISLISITSFAQTKEDINTEKETALLFKQVLKTDSLDILVKESTKNSWISECYVFKNTKFFKRNEINIINQRLKKDNQLSWNNRSILNFKIIKDSLFDNSDRDKLVKELNQNILVFSHPIFLKKDKYCVLFFQFICGNICGASSLALYEKIGKRWKKKEEYCDMIN